MSKKKGGFFDDLARAIELQGIVEASKDASGKPDKWKAAGMAFGMGYSSWDDTMELGALLGAQGAFDNDSYGSSHSADEDKYFWRVVCEDGSDWGLDPEEYETEEEYDEALYEAKYGWRENCEDGSEWNIYPEDYETEEEYLENLNDAKYEWRDFAEDGSEWNLDPEDFETEEEYIAALEEAQNTWNEDCEDDIECVLLSHDYINKEVYETEKYAWREYAEDGSKWNLNPKNFDTEEAYEEALEYEKNGWRFDVEDGSQFNVEKYDFERKEDYIAALEVVKAKIPKKEDYPNRRKYLAAKKLFEFETSGFYDPADEYDKMLHDRYEFILNNPGLLASNYLTPNGEFVFAQALKENFNLPITVKSEDEKPKSNLNEVLERIAKKDPTQACELWIWCIETFAPYSKYEDEAGTVVGDVCAYIGGYPELFRETLWKELDEKTGLLRMIFDTCEDSHIVGITLMYEALEKNDSVLAKKILNTYLSSQYATEQRVYDLLNDVVMYCCEKTYDLIAAECFKSEIIPIISEFKYQDVLDTIEEWTEKLDEQIEDVERYSEKYQYSRRYLWRTRCQDGSKWYVDPLEYETEQEYNAALLEAKYEWRTWREDGAEFGLDPMNYETEDEFNEAIRSARKLAREEARRKELEEREKQKEEHRKQIREERLISNEQDDSTIYTFYGVEFEIGGHIYHYLKNDVDYQIGDQVIVPVGKKNREQLATIVTVQQHLRRNASYPVEKAKKVLRKI